MRTTAMASKGERGGRLVRAFTLVELLVAIGIIGILATISLPAIRGLTQSNILAAAHRQFVDDLNLARQYAIGGHRTVYVVFVPPTVTSHFETIRRDDDVQPGARNIHLSALTNLVNGQYTAYALFVWRSAGEQVGKGKTYPRYLTDWRNLPDGMYFETNKFVQLKPAEWSALAETNRPLPYASFPLPLAISPLRDLPYIAFDASGRLLYEGRKQPNQPDQVVALERGSIFYEKNTNGAYVLTAPPDVVKTTKATNTLVRISYLTGRTRVEGMTLKN